MQSPDCTINSWPLDTKTGKKVPHIIIPPDFPECQYCKIKDGLHLWTFKIIDLRLGQRAACPQCSLIMMSIVSMYPGKLAHGEKVVFRSYRPGAFSFFWDDGTHSNDEWVELFTLVGVQQCRLPVVAIRRLTPERNGADYLPILSDWLRNCLQDHDECRSSDEHLPTRVLDIGTSTLDPICLHTTSGKVGRYIAFSHCWGEDASQIARTTKMNIERRFQCIPPRELPRSFLEVISVARSLHVRYLWIDSLCIIQDDKRDWEVESSKMASTYHDALLVVGASCARDSSEGFISSPSYGTAEQQVATVRNTDGTVADVYVREAYPHSDVCFSTTETIVDARRGPLASRGWTMQEQILSTRMVHFEQFEMFWECRTLTACECLELTRRDSYKTRLDAEVAAGSLEGWHALVRQYGQRSLTYKLDFLPALSGIATRRQKLGAGPYLAGLWKQDLLRELLWSVGSWTQDIVSRLVRSQPYRAPTWSWASIHNPISGGGLPCSYIQHSNSTPKEPLCHIVSAVCVPLGYDDNGTVRSGEIVIKGMMLVFARKKHGICNKQQWQPDDILPHQRRGDGISSSSFHLILDIDEDYEETQLHGMFLTYCVEKSRWIRIEGLVLREAVGKETVFERVGYWGFHVHFTLKHPLSRLLGRADNNIDESTSRSELVKEAVESLLAHIPSRKITIV